jgi:hypothetical protein
MNRVRNAVAFVLLALVLVAGPAALAQEGPAVEDTTTTSFVNGPPAVLVDTSPATPAEEAWTFRFLVPTLLVLTGIGIVAVVGAYGVRVLGRYRVAR